ncbi:AAA family ATPase [bacterium]|nr:AAA family ATPase [bacterium]
MAKLMVHRELFKTFGRLPSKVQKKVYELMKKFEEDSIQASLHLEKVNNVKDKKVRSARVGDDYRAIIIAPEQGDTYLLMYVDHHDEAYRWCGNKQFETHTSLGSFQVFDVGAAQELVSQEQFQPKEEEESYILDDFSDDELFKAGVPESLIPAVRAVKDDNTFEQMAEYLPTEASQVLYGIVCGLSLDQALEETLGFMRLTSNTPVGPGDFSQLANTMSMDLVLVEGEEHLKEVLSEDIEEWRIFLHPYQQKLVRWDVNGPMKINGAAGTGKTVALMHRAVWLARNSEVDEKTLVTTYTTNLSVTIKVLIEQMAPELNSKIEVTNLHQLARTISLRGGWKGKIAEDSDREQIWESVLKVLKPEESEFSEIGIIDEYNQIVDRMGIDNEDDYLTVVRSGRKRIGRKQRKLFWQYFAAFQRELIKRNMLTFEGVVHQARLVVEQGNFPQYRYVLVDELQDFGLEALRLIKAISPIDQELANPLCVVGDGHQRLYGNVPIPLSRAGINVRGRSRRLKINYRTSEQIRQWAHGLLYGLEIDDLDGNTVDTTGDRSVFRGDNPKIIQCSDFDEAGKAVIEWIKGLKAAKFGEHEICVVPTIPQIITAVKSAGIQTLQLKPRQRDPGKEEQGIRHGTKKRIKGLEFRAIALVITADDPDAHKHFANYVAATRAREQLLVVQLRE